MQYRILDSNGQIIAWLDSNKDEQLIHKDYILEVAEQLNAIELDGNLVPIINIQ